MAMLFMIMAAFVGVFLEFVAGASTTPYTCGTNWAKDYFMGCHGNFVTKTSFGGSGGVGCGCDVGTDLSSEDIYFAAIPAWMHEYYVGSTKAYGTENPAQNGMLPGIDNSKSCTTSNDFNNCGGGCFQCYTATEASVNGKIIDPTCLMQGVYESNSDDPAHNWCADGSCCNVERAPKTYTLVAIDNCGVKDGYGTMNNEWCWPYVTNPESPANVDNVYANVCSDNSRCTYEATDAPACAGIENLQPFTIQQSNFNYAPNASKPYSTPVWPTFNVTADSPGAWRFSFQANAGTATIPPLTTANGESLGMTSKCAPIAKYDGTTQPASELLSDAASVESKWCRNKFGAIGHFDFIQGGNGPSNLILVDVKKTECPTDNPKFADYLKTKCNFDVGATNTGSSLNSDATKNSCPNHVFTINSLGGANSSLPMI
jgi:hypothetical protein